VKICCGDIHNLALVVGSEGGLKVVSWGIGFYGQLGLGGTEEKKKPEVIGGLAQLEGVEMDQVELFCFDETSTIVVLPPVEVFFFEFDSEEVAERFAIL